ncbi:MAG: PHP domain-containing protein [Oscillospiraceae bacterium]|nr:PHP domain-containing protein [Oscillospiraceae bacterium]
MTGDMHCHTRLSDGAMGLEEVVFYAKRSGLDFLAITDHDTMAGVTRAGIIGNRYGIRIIPGVELSCYDYERKRRVHLLCYLPQKPDRLEGICKKTCEARNEAGKQMTRMVSRFYPITAQLVMKYASGSKAIFKQHIMMALMELGYTDRIYGGLYDQLFDPHHGSCLVDTVSPDIHEVIDLVHLAQGKAVLAHPSTYHSEDLLLELVEKKQLDGIEVYHPRNTPEEQRQWKTLAEENGLLQTGGSDFHGFYTSSPNPLGSCMTSGETLDQLFSDMPQKS